MPNRKTFDEREKYDHSAHPVGNRQPSDLQPDIQDKDDKVVKKTSADSAESSQGDKPDDPAYCGGEDETTDNSDAGHRSKNFPVDESDDSPPTAPRDTGDGR